MRKTILFVARFDTILKGTNALLAKTFNMQICPPSPEVFEKTLDVVEMDLLLLYISGLTSTQIAGLCDRIIRAEIKIPIVVFGTVEECSEFSKKQILIHAKKYLFRPITPQEIVKSLCTLLNVDYNESSQPEAAPEAVQSVASSAAPSAAPSAPKVTVDSILQMVTQGAAPNTAPSTAPDSAKDVTPKMSISDFADSLEDDKRRCILVVDDSGSILRAMKMLLEKKYRVNLANSALSGIASIERDRPDAVLLDYEMPEYNGKQALGMIRQNKQTQDLPVFFLTGVSDKERVKEVLSLKPHGYFLKNSDPGVILEALDKFFKESGRDSGK